jgi:dTDP-4-dehydrorhamnose reductase
MNEKNLAVKNNVLIIGATGYIGKPLYSLAKVSCSAKGTSTVGTNLLIPLVLDALGKFDHDIIQPLDVVLITAAISAPDICAREHERAWLVNVIGTSDFIANIIARGGRVIFFSSDTVYGEQDKEFDERASCNPAGEYAEMKQEVEKRFLGNPLFKTIRLSYVFSKEDKFTKYLWGCAERDEEAEVFHPFYRAVVHRDDVVDGALALALRWDEFPQQVINFGGPEILARTEFAETMQQSALPRLRFRVTEPAAKFFENRPRIIAMKSPVLPKLLGRPVRTLLEAANIEFTVS